MKFKSNENGLFKTNELKTDTVWFRAKEKNVEMTATNENLIFEKIELPNSEIDKIQKDIKISQNFSDKGIIYECGYTIKEVGYFYKRVHFFGALFYHLKPKDLLLILIPHRQQKLHNPKIKKLLSFVCFF